MEVKQNRKKKLSFAFLLFSFLIRVKVVRKINIISVHTFWRLRRLLKNRNLLVPLVCTYQKNNFLKFKYHWRFLSHSFSTNCKGHSTGWNRAQLFTAVSVSKDTGNCLWQTKRSGKLEYWKSISLLICGYDVSSNQVYFDSDVEWRLYIL